VATRHSVEAASGEVNSTALATRWVHLRELHGRMAEVCRARPTRGQYLKDSPRSKPSSLGYRQHEHFTQTAPVHDVRSR